MSGGWLAFLVFCGRWRVTWTPSKFTRGVEYCRTPLAQAPTCAGPGLLFPARSREAVDEAVFAQKNGKREEKYLYDGASVSETQQVAGHFALPIYQFTFAYTYLQEPTDIQ